MKLSSLIEAPRLRLGAAALIAAAAAAAAATAIAVRPCAPDAPSATSALAPDAAAVRYRHAVPTGAGTTASAASSALAMLDESITALEARLRTPAGSPFDRTELADLYLRRAKWTGDAKDYASAEAEAKRSLELLPSPNAAVIVLAKLASARHDFGEAIALAHRHARGRSTGALTVLATSHLALGELAQAGAAAEALVEQQPDGAAYLMRALVMQAQGRDAEAAFDFGRAAAVEEPGDPEEAARLRALWGRFLLRRGEVAGARRVLDEALRIAPGHALALAQQGELLLRTGRARDARARFEQAFAASRQVRYLIDQARALELAGDRAGADQLRAQVERIVRAELTEGGLGHRLDLVEVLVDRGAAADLPEAVALAREEVARRPSADARFQLARALAKTGARDESLREVQAALATGAREAALFELAARLEQLRKSTGRAALYAREADRLDPGGAASAWRKVGLP